MLIASPVVIAWALTLLTPTIGRFLAFRAPNGPDLPYLLSPNPNTDIRSSPFAFVPVVAIAVGAAAVAELAKIGTRNVSRIAAVLVFQLALVTDCVRAYAWDWWTYFVIVLERREVTWYETVPISAVRWPWIAALVAVVVFVFISASPKPATVPAN